MENAEKPEDEDEDESSQLDENQEESISNLKNDELAEYDLDNYDEEGKTGTRSFKSFVIDS